MRQRDTPAETRAGLILALVCAGQFMVVLDVAVVNVALPSIQLDLGVSQNDLQWAVVAYGIFLGGFLLLGGRAADLLGRRKVFVSGIAIFAGASLVAGLSTTLGVLVIARGAQGFGAALTASAGLSILTATFEEGPARTKALGIWGAISASGATAGVVMSGLLTDGPGWEWIFFINVPVGIALAAGALLFLTRDLRRAPAELRRPRGGDDHRGPAAPGVRGQQGRDLGLDRRAHRRRAGGRARPARRVPRHRDPGGAAARAPAARREPDGGSRQRRRVPPPGLVLLADLHRDPLHAAGPRLQRPRGRARLAHRLGARPRGGGDDRRGARRADRRASHPRHGAHDPDGRPLRPVPAGRRLDVRRAAFSPGSSSPASGSACASRRRRSRPSPASTSATAGSPRVW